MTKDELTPEAYAALLHSIVPVVTANGLKHTTMDMVAARLQMSKRTLYEIFGSKNEMVKEVLDHLFHEFHTRMEESFLNSENVLVGLMRVFDLQRQFMSRVNASFFRDLDAVVDLKKEYHSKRSLRQQQFRQLCKAGIEQGVLRPDVNFMVLVSLLDVQMESLKRMEEFFPSDITLLDAYDTIFMSFLRTIVSRKGLDILESTLTSMSMAGR